MIEEKLSLLLDKQQQVDAASQLVADCYGHFSRDKNRPESQLQKKTGSFNDSDWEAIITRRS
jgi:hypothetical protein